MYMNLLTLVVYLKVFDYHFLNFIFYNSLLFNFRKKIKLEKKLEQISFKSLDNIAWLEEVKKLKEVKVLDKLLIDEQIEDIVIDENQNIKAIFKCEDKYFEALDFINRQNYDIISSS